MDLISKFAGCGCRIMFRFLATIIHRLWAKFGLFLGLFFFPSRGFLGGRKGESKRKEKKREKKEPNVNVNIHYCDEKLAVMTIILFPYEELRELQQQAILTEKCKMQMPHNPGMVLVVLQK
jgi:hypothetical protein